MLDWLSLGLGVLGAGVVFVGAILVFKSKPGSPRYQQSGMSFGTPSSLTRYIADQRRASSVVVLGAGISLVASLVGVIGR